MSDDGLMLNFAAPSANPSARRVSGKRHHERPRYNNSSANSSKAGNAHPPPTAAGPRTSIPPSSTADSIVQSKPATTSSSNILVDDPIASTSTLPAPPLPGRSATRTVATAHGGAPNGSAPAAAPRKGGFVSSLFTGDESFKNRTSAVERKTVEATPTNAPSAGTPFGALGLDPLLVSHLQSPRISIEQPTSIQRNSLPFLLSPANAGRDTLLHAQTGSGKTLSYLLPIIQSLLPLCETSWIDRSSLGTVAIILVPTRELAQQIYEVAEKLCSLHLTARSEETEREVEGMEASATTMGIRRTRWIIPGIVSGGATRNHEKNRLRKGLPIIVATPGRLLDHLRNTTSFDVGRLQWLVLDEADRLLQLGFEQTLNDIMKAIDGRRRASCEVQRSRMKDELGTQGQGQVIADEDVTDSFGETWWKFPRRTILCSATLDEGVQVLAGKSLSSPRIIRGDAERGEEKDVESTHFEKSNQQRGTMNAPAQLKQNFIVMPTKQRLILLVALLRQAIASGKSKIMVFLSCTDSVDFHWSALGGVKMSTNGTTEKAVDVKGPASLRLESELLPSTAVFKLHGSLSQHERQSSLRLFAQCKQSAVLLCTSVASRGLDLDVSMVVQLDPPSEKGVDEYLHRIGRTARVGEEGESWLLLLPSEEGCVSHYEKEMGDQGNGIQRQEPNQILNTGFTGQDTWQTQARATEVQMAFEKWVMDDEEHTTLARKAYLSHLRAYATHPPSERQYFSLNNLQLGHLAKAFALREAPGVIRSKFKSSIKAAKKSDQSLGTDQPGKKRKRDDTMQEKKKKKNKDQTRDDDRGASDNDTSGTDEEQPMRKHLDFARNKESEAKMYAKVREMGKLNRKGGVMGAYGAEEYQIG
ncbi:hypothetical protein CBS101457_003829 [Exobasidium rhododendri]|nr:hypothetical protein CBS101457_003829 [Exobasidium rhododendri]